MSNESSRSKGFGGIGKIIFALVLAGSALLLTVTLYSECSAGSDALDEYFSLVKGGRSVSVEVAGDEAEALTTLLRESRSITIDNFQGQAGTSCYWVSIEQPKGRTKAVFVLKERSPGMVVSAASIARGCTCPDPDHDKPCGLK